MFDIKCYFGIIANIRAEPTEALTGEHVKPRPSSRLLAKGAYDVGFASYLF